jgi:hypothetical protein
MLNIDDIIAYENGELDHDGVLDLFAKLIRTGAVWRLQGSYGRTAASLIESGLISRSGKRID